MHHSHYKRTMLLDEFTIGYMECALWASNDESDSQGGEPLDLNYCFEDFTSSAYRDMLEDCRCFQEENKVDLDNIAQDDFSGHNFWLTRNGHGTGFWDRDYGEMGDRLTQNSEPFGECHLYITDSGKVGIM